jgi:hypothetical protein
VRATLIAAAAACDPTSAKDWVQDAYQDPAANARAAAVYATAVYTLLWTPLTNQTLLSCWDDGDPLPASWQWQWDLNSWLDSALGRLTRDDRGEILTALAGSPLPAARQAAVDAADHLLAERRWELSDLVYHLTSLAGDPDPDVSSSAGRKLDNQFRLMKSDSGPVIGFPPRGVRPVAS